MDPYEPVPPTTMEPHGAYEPSSPHPAPGGSRGLALAVGGRTIHLGWPVLLLFMGLLAVLAVGCSAALNGSPSLFTAAPSNGLAIGAPTAPVASPPASAADLQQTVITVIRNVQPSVVEITSSGGQGRAIGSGEIITNDGYIVTNDHVVRGFSSYRVTLANGQSAAARLVGEAPDDDLAVLKTDLTNLHPIAFGSSANVQVGQFVIAIGSPLGLEQSATFGIVSALNRTGSEGPDGPAAQLTGLIQTSAPINPGNSGGALVDLQGQLIGVPTLAAANPQNGGAADGIGFAIPSDRVKVVAQQLIQHGSAPSTRQGFLGIQGQDVTPELASAYNLPVQSGVLIAGFVGDASGKSPAEQAGLRQSDIIIKLNGRDITGNATLASALSSLQPGTSVTLVVARGQQQVSVKVTLGERP